MMPDQSQGACQAIEDAAALGIVFSKEHFRGNTREALEVYEQVRKPRATRVQSASARARENINERIGRHPVALPPFPELVQFFSGYAKGVDYRILEQHK